MTEITTQQEVKGNAGAAPSSRPPFRGGPRRGGPGGARGPGGGASRGGNGGGRGRGGSSRGGFGERTRPEFETKIIQIRRVTRVVAGGRRFSFSVALIAGNRKGSVGVGVGKASDTSLAVEKATKNAKKNMIKVNLSPEMMIAHEVSAKASSGRVLIVPAPGRGMVAGSSVRNVLELAGIKNVSAKILSGTKNKLNNARAAVKALSQVKARRAIKNVSK